MLTAPVETTHTDVNWERLEGVRASLLWQPNENLSITPTAFYQRIDQGSPNYVDVPPSLQHRRGGRTQRGPVKQVGRNY